MFKDLIIQNENQPQIETLAKKLNIQPIFLQQKKDSYTSKKPEIHLSKATRNNIENTQKKYHYFAEHLEQKDSLHHRRSGMNQTLMKLMKTKKKTLIITTSHLQEHQDKPLILARIQQNLNLAKKHKVPIIIATLATKPQHLKSKQELKSLITTLGHPQTAKQATNHKYH